MNLNEVETKYTSEFLGTISPNPIVVRVMNMKYRELPNDQCSMNMNTTASKVRKTVMSSIASQTGAFKSVSPSVLQQKMHLN